MYQAGGTFQMGGSVTIKINNVDTTYTGSGGTISSNTASNNGGGLAMGGGTLTMHGGSISSNHADNGFGGAVYQGGGSFTLNGGLIGAKYKENSTTEVEGAGNKAKRGAGLFILNGTGTAAGQKTAVNIFGGKIMYNEASESGGGIAVGNRTDGGPITGETICAELKLQGNIEVWENKQGTEWCNVLFDWDAGIDETNDPKNNEVIWTTSKGLTPESHIGVYVPGVMTDEDSLFGRHGDWNKPFGTFKNAQNVNRFINDRTELYAYYYGVPHPEDPDNRIYWVDYVCKITDENHKLLFENADGTAPALYMYLGEYGAFDALAARTFYRKNADSSFTEATPKYVEIMVQYYTEYWEKSIAVPAKTITLMTALEHVDGASETGYSTSDTTHVDYKGQKGTFCTISRKAGFNGPLFTTAAGGALTLQNITIDGRSYTIP